MPVSEAFYEAAYTFGYGKNIVNVTLVDIRAWDTMGEISVLVVAATGVASLIFIRAAIPPPPMRADGRSRRGDRPAKARPDDWLRGSERCPDKRSIVFEVVTRVLFPVMIMVSVYFLIAATIPRRRLRRRTVAGMALIIRYLAAVGTSSTRPRRSMPAGCSGPGCSSPGSARSTPALLGGRSCRAPTSC